MNSLMSYWSFRPPARRKIEIVLYRNQKNVHKDNFCDCETLSAFWGCSCESVPYVHGIISLPTFA